MPCSITTVRVLYIFVIWPKSTVETCSVWPLLSFTCAGMTTIAALLSKPVMTALPSFTLHLNAIPRLK